LLKKKGTSCSCECNDGNDDENENATVAAAGFRGEEGEDVFSSHPPLRFMTTSFLTLPFFSSSLPTYVQLLRHFLPGEKGKVNKWDDHLQRGCKIQNQCANASSTLSRVLAAACCFHPVW